MNFLFSDAFAATPTATANPQQAGGLNIILISVLFIAIFYFLMIRPQAKRNKAQQQLLNDLQNNDEVVTVGGMLGRIVKIEENIVTLELAENTQIKIQKNAIASLLPKGTLKN